MTDPYYNQEPPENQAFYQHQDFSIPECYGHYSNGCECKQCADNYIQDLENEVNGANNYNQELQNNLNGANSYIWELQNKLKDHDIKRQKEEVRKKVFSKYPDFSLNPVPNIGWVLRAARPVLIEENINSDEARLTTRYIDSFGTAYSKTYFCHISTQKQIQPDDVNEDSPLFHLPFDMPMCKNLAMHEKDARLDYCVTYLEKLFLPFNNQVA